MSSLRRNSCWSKLTGSDQPDGTLGLGHDSAATPERDLSASSGIEIVIGEPDPHALGVNRKHVVYQRLTGQESPERTSR